MTSSGAEPTILHLIDRAGRGAVGSAWAHAQGREGGDAIVSGAHLDPQCLGGRYDGAVGAVGVRVAMAFVRGEDGCGHTPGEVSKLDDIVAGTRVPAAGLHALVYR